MSRPPQPDWFVALELAADVGVDVYRHEQIDLTPENVAVVKTWLLIRRQALALAQQIRAAAAELERAHRGKRPAA